VTAITQTPETPQVIDCAKSLDQIDGLVAAYLESTAYDTVEIDRALARGDVLKVASMAHRIKLSAATVGVAELSEAAGRIEACYRRGSFELLPFEVDAFCRTHLTLGETRTKAS
jgi:HPt (histidine-containing phosphotransfer) domain-containing protein